VKKHEPEQLSRRERQITEIIYRLGKATTAEIMAELPDAPGNSTVRSLLTILERKGHLQHQKDGKTFVYFPTVPREKAGKTALQRLQDNFFNGSRDLMVATLLELPPSDELSSELDLLTEKIEKARRKAKQSEENDPQSEEGNDA